jgi:2-amino-4-hydroxy-6-hydroxymethyldihydropteridine diphosphokinase
MKHRAFLGLGSNQGDRLAYLQQAIFLLGQHPSIERKRLSSLYETAPVGYLEQPAFYNLVCEVETSLAPTQLLDVALDIEKRLDRVRMIRWGPRTVDIDLLLYDEVIIKQSHLVVPHPRMTERAFVLVPLAELIPDMIIPGTSRSVRQWQERLPSDQWIERLPVDIEPSLFFDAENLS